MIVAYRRPLGRSGRLPEKLRAAAPGRATRSTTTSTPRNTTASQAERPGEREQRRPLEHRREPEVVLQIQDVHRAPARGASAGPSTSIARSRGRHCIGDDHDHGDEQTGPRRDDQRRDETGSTGTTIRRAPRCTGVTPRSGTGHSSPHVGVGRIAARPRPSCAGGTSAQIAITRHPSMARARDPERGPHPALRRPLEHDVERRLLGIARSQPFA